ncbi:MAG: HEPN domain-containing protein [Candidatus Daviesbacteria bacterium]|nr:HEPN domain-containing protein [Candidatus Daviesbacteria bacterium]
MVDKQVIKNWLDKAGNDLDFAKANLQEGMEHDPEFNEVYETVKFLNPFYIGTRYPDFIISVDKSNTEKALQVAEQSEIIL